MNIQKLLNALHDMSAIHEELLQLAQEKQRLVIENRIDQLIGLISKETKAIAAMEKLSEDVRRCTREYWAENGIPPKPDLTLSDLLQVLTKADAKVALTEAADRLKSLTRSLKEINERNQTLVRQALGMVEDMLDLLTGVPEEPVYQAPTRKTAEPKRSGLFDARA